jgi:hypothetical protein
MGLGSDTLLVVEWQGEGVGGNICIGREGLIGVLVSLGVIEVLSGTKRELHGGVVTRPYHWLLLWQLKHRQRHSNLSQACLPPRPSH